MKYDVENRIRRQEQRIANPEPAAFGAAMKTYCETGEFPDGTHPRVKEYTLKALAFAQAMRDGMGVG